MHRAKLCIMASIEHSKNRITTMVIMMLIIVVTMILKNIKFLKKKIL